MIQITLQFSTIAAAVSALARIDADAIVAGDPVPHASVKATSEAPGKPAATEAVKPVRGRPTAEAAAATDAPAKTADEPTPAAADAAAKPQASTAAEVSYPDLQKAVLTLHKMDATAALPIAQGLGAATFKLLPEAKWAEALRLVNVAIEARKAA